MSDIATLLGPASAPATLDRRIIHRVSTVWTQAARGRFPSWADMRATDLGVDWNWIFGVDLAKSNGYPHFSFLGPNLARLAEIYIEGGGDWAVSLLDRAAADINASVAAEGPHLVEDMLTLEDGRELLFRSMTAPLAEDGRFISHAVGVVSGRLGGDDAAAFNPVNDA